MPNTATNSQKSPKAKRSSHQTDKVSHVSQPATPLHSKILAAKKEHPNLNNTQLAKLINTPRETVSRILTRYGIDIGAVEAYQSHRADILDALGCRIASSITNEDIQKASLLQRLSAYGIAYDKMRIERGLSDGSSKPMVQINIVARSTPIPSITQSTQAIDISTHDSSTHQDIPPSVPPNDDSDSPDL